MLAGQPIGATIGVGNKADIVTAFSNIFAPNQQGNFRYKEYSEN